MKKLQLLIIPLLVLGATLIAMVPAGANEVCTREDWWKCPPQPVCPDPPGVGTPGYWKNHVEDWDVYWLPGAFEELGFPVNCKGLDDCGVGDCCLLSPEELADLMDNPVQGNKVYTLLRALVAAKLNRFACNPTDCEVVLDNGQTVSINWVIGAAADWMMDYGYVDGGCGELAVCEASDDCWQGHGEELYELLDAYNNGELCALSRDAIEELAELGEE